MDNIEIRKGTFDRIQEFQGSDIDSKILSIIRHFEFHSLDD